MSVNTIISQPIGAVEPWANLTVNNCTVYGNLITKGALTDSFCRVLTQSAQSFGPGTSNAVWNTAIDATYPIAYLSNPGGSFTYVGDNEGVTVQPGNYSVNIVIGKGTLTNTTATTYSVQINNNAGPNVLFAEVVHTVTPAGNLEQTLPLIISANIHIASVQTLYVGIGSTASNAFLPSNFNGTTASCTWSMVKL